MITINVDLIFSPFPFSFSARLHISSSERARAPRSANSIATRICRHLTGARLVLPNCFVNLPRNRKMNICNDRNASHAVSSRTYILLTREKILALFTQLRLPPRILSLLVHLSSSPSVLHFFSFSLLSPFLTFYTAPTTIHLVSTPPRPLSLSRLHYETSGQACLQHDSRLLSLYISNVLRRTFRISKNICERLRMTHL